MAHVAANELHWPALGKLPGHEGKPQVMWAKIGESGPPRGGLEAPVDTIDPLARLRIPTGPQVLKDVTRGRSHEPELSGMLPQCRQRGIRQRHSTRPPSLRLPSTRRIVRKRHQSPLEVHIAPF